MCSWREYAADGEQLRSVDNTGAGGKYDKGTLLERQERGPLLWSSMAEVSRRGLVKKVKGE